MTTAVDVTAIAQQLREANWVYYAGGTPMADEDYDNLKRKLRALDPEHPLLAEVGAPVNPTSGLQKAKHRIPMGSLDNAMGADDIRKFVRRVVKALADAEAGFPSAFVTQPKMDGFSVSLRYKRGLFVQAVTRGDGVEGEDVTHTLIKAKGVPMALTEPLSFSVRGETVIHRDDFAKHFVDYSNMRAAAAGTARRLDGARAEFLQFYAFNAAPHGAEPIAKTEQKLIERLDALGFRTVESVLVGGQTEDEIIESLVAVWEEWKVRRPSMPFDMDGVVAKVSNLARSEACGVSGNCPRAMVAMKWPGSMTARSKVVGITHSVGRTGSITPVATIDRVECGGVVIQSVSLANWDEVNRLGVGLGAEVIVERAGEVIPKITKVTKPGPSGVFIRPAKCPHCATATVQDGPRQYCRNPDCGAQSYRKVWHYVQKRVIMHLGPETIDALMALDGPVQAASDLYRLSVMDLTKATGSQANAAKIIGSINESRDVTLDGLVGSVGIVGFGTTDALKLCRALGLQTLEQFLGLTREEVFACDGFAEEKADGLMAGIEEWRDELLALAKHLRIAPPRAKGATGPLAGKSFCITGTTEMSRDALKAVLIKAGGEWHSSVVNGLDFLVMADANSTSNKAEAARKKGVRVMSEREALDLAGYTS